VKAFRVTCGAPVASVIAPRLGAAASPLSCGVLGHIPPCLIRRDDDLVDQALDQIWCPFGERSLALDPVGALADQVGVVALSLLTARTDLIRQD